MQNYFLIAAFLLLGNLIAETDTESMKRIKFNGIELEYEIKGSGEPIVLAHAGVFADWFKPLMNQKALIEQYRLIRYHRIGYAGSSRLHGPVSIKQQAEHLHLLLQKLEIKKAHIVGHSSSGNIALQFALDFPESVQSLVLLEPALRVEKNATERAKAFTVIREHYKSGDKTAALDAFMKEVTGKGYRVALDAKLPGSFDHAIKDADTFFAQELPALQQWSFTKEDARRIKQPVLAVIGGKNKEHSEVWNERHEMLLAWLPNVESFVLPNATHLLHLDNPSNFTQALISFCKKHSIHRKDAE